MILKLALIVCLSFVSSEDNFNDLRLKRSLQPGAPNINNGNKQPWEVSPNIERDEHGNVRTDINVKNHGENHDVQAGWGKVVRGPARAKPTWHVGGTYRWRRSLQPGAPNVNNGNKQPWEVSPNIERDEHGNVRTDINVKNHGENHDVDAGWGKVVRGPARAKPTWHVGGTYRWRRSPWEVSPNDERDKADNVRTDINVQNHGENHYSEAGWDKVVKEPTTAKPTRQAGDTYSWKSFRGTW